MKTLLQSFMGSFLVTLFFFSSCTKSSSTGGGSTTPTDSINADVYVVGYETIAGVAVAKLWKNGVGTNLTDGKRTAGATGISMIGSDIYISIIEYSGNIPVAKLWKNGQLYNLGNGVQYSWATGISEGVVVGARNDAATGRTTAGYWSGDGVFTQISNPAFQNAYANGIHIKRVNNVLKTSVCGDIDVSNSLASKNTFFWGGQNSNPTLSTLGLVNENSFGKACFINDNGFTYIAGRQNVPTLWFEGVPSMKLSDSLGNANGLFVVGYTNIYAVGYEINNRKFIGKLWKGDTRGSIQSVTITNTQYNGNLNAIKVVDGNEFIAGEEADASGFYFAKYWKNGKAVALGGSNSSAVAIWVVKK